MRGTEGATHFTQGGGREGDREGFLGEAAAPALVLNGDRGEPPLLRTEERHLRWVVGKTAWPEVGMGDVLEDVRARKIMGGRAGMEF